MKTFVPIPEKFACNPRPVFIVGAPYAATTLLQYPLRNQLARKYWSRKLRKVL